MAITATFMLNKIQFTELRYTKSFLSYGHLFVSHCFFQNDKHV